MGDPTKNEDARRVSPPSARQNFPSGNKTQLPQSGKSPEKHWEDRANWASCFPPRNPKSQHPPNFTGITVLDGRKYWVNLYSKLDRNGNPYFSVNIRPFSADRE